VLRGFFNSLLGSKPAGPAQSLSQVTSKTVTEGVVPQRSDLPIHGGRPVPSYPDRGVAAPAVPPEMLIESQREKIDALHQVSSFSREDFDAYIIPAIKLYAEYVHLLPASESQHHCGQGGLFRHGLEVAFNAALACEGKVFAFDHWASERDKLVPRWRMCAILGGMVHDMGKPIIDVGAVDESGDRIWNPHAGSLYAWLTEHKLTEYYIHWRPGARHKRHEAFNAVALYRIVPDATLRWITAHGGQEPLDALIMALSGTSDPSNPLAALIKQADSKSVSKDIQDSRSRLAASGLGGVRSLAVRLVRAMHDLIQDGVWEPNKVGSPIWVTTEGVFGLYPAVVKGAVDLLREQGDNSLPNDYTATLDVLSDWGYIHPNILPNGQQFHTWNIRIFAKDRGKPMEFDSHVVRFSKEDLLPRAMIPPEVVKATVLGHDGKPITSGGVVSPQQQGTREAAPPQSAPSPPATESPGDDARVLTSQIPLAAVDTTEDSAALLLGVTPDEGLLYADAAGQDDDRVDLLTLDGEERSNRDRSREMDPRDELILMARTQMSKQWPPETPEAAAAYFRTQGTEGQLIITLANRVCSGELKEGEQVWDVQEKVHLRYPEAFANLGMSDEDIREMLEAKGWTERDSQTPTRKSVMLNVGNGKKAVTLRFNENISLAIQMLLPARSGAGALSKAANKRVLPLGPFIDADVAGSIKDMNSPTPEDGPLLRPAFHQFALQSVNETGTSLEALTFQEVAATIQKFVKQHRLSSEKWLNFHLSRGTNPWAVKSGPNAGSQLVYNPQYQLDADLREQVARGIA